MTKYLLALATLAGLLLMVADAQACHRRSRCCTPSYYYPPCEDVVVYGIDASGKLNISGRIEGDKVINEVACQGKTVGGLNVNLN